MLKTQDFSLSMMAAFAWAAVTFPCFERGVGEGLVVNMFFPDGAFNNRYFVCFIIIYYYYYYYYFYFSEKRTDVMFQLTSFFLL